MAGGTFTEGIEKVRPGLYMNFVTKAEQTMSIGERGTVIFPMILDWGASEGFIEINAESDVFDKLGFSVADTISNAIFVREAMKEAKTVMIYRLNGKGAEKAMAVFAEGLVSAVCGGVRGNDISITVTADVVDETKFYVRTFVGSKVVDEQLVSKYGELVNNAFVTFTFEDAQKDKAVTATSKVVLTGGTNATVENSNYIDFMEATETQEFDVIGFPVTDGALQETFISFIKRIREEEGKRVQGVIPNYNGVVDYEGIIDVCNGVVLSDGSKLTAVEAVAWVAGASAGAQINESNTYARYNGAIDANPRMKNTEILTALKNGKFVFSFQGNTRVVVEKDINSLVNYGTNKSYQFSKNRTIRVLDAINNDLLELFTDNYIGKLDNNGDGLSILSTAVGLYLRTLEDNKAIKNYDPKNDFVIDTAKSIGDSVYAIIGVQPVDSMEKFYFTVEVR